MSRISFREANPENIGERKEDKLEELTAMYLRGEITVKAFREALEELNPRLDLRKLAYKLDY